MKLGKPKDFLGIEVHEQQNKDILLTQTKNIKDLLVETNMKGANGINTPMFNHCKLSKHGTYVIYDPTLYKSTVGALQYVTLTRSDITSV